MPSSIEGITFSHSLLPLIPIIFIHLNYKNDVNNDKGDYGSTYRNLYWQKYQPPRTFEYIGEFKYN